MTALASNYRTFELPWTPSEEEERRFKRLLLIAFIIFALGGLVIPLLPVEERALAPPVPEEAVKLVLQPPPVPPKPEVKPKEEPKPVEEKPLLTLYREYFAGKPFVRVKESLEEPARLVLDL